MLSPSLQNYWVGGPLPTPMDTTLQLFSDPVPRGAWCGYAYLCLLGNVVSRIEKTRPNSFPR